MPATALCYQFFELPLRRRLTARLCVPPERTPAPAGRPGAARAA
jgi:hypothetical protein